MNNISFKDVIFTGGFLKNRYDLNKDVSISSVYNRFEESGRFDALRFKYKEGEIYPHIFFDSDVAKWIEAVGYLIISGNECSKEQKVIDALVEDMKKNQYQNGYLNSHFMQIEPENIFKKRGDHELYCAGHLIEAAIAYDKATNKNDFLNIMIKYVDYINQVFFVEKSAAFSTCGHEEIELALVKLYEHTLNDKYLKMALNFVDLRGSLKEVPVADCFNNKYDQSEKPVRELTKAEGHAVRAVYLYTAMAELANKYQDKSLFDTCERLFDNIVNQRMYITGGIGSAKSGEAFTVDYDLPNLEAYSESCAAIGLMIFALGMQKSSLDVKYGHVIERIMYNNLLSSTSLDGKAFFYENPLEIHLSSVDKETATHQNYRTNLPIRKRLEVFDCSCCPPNINRIFARLGDFFFIDNDKDLIINQFGDLTLNTNKINMIMKSNYPVDGKVNIHFEEASYNYIFIRIPYWCEKYNVNVPFSVKDGYIVIDCKYNDIVIDFNMEAYFVEANIEVRANNGRVALCYGPTVYCLERIDNDFPLNALSFNLDAAFTFKENNSFLLPEIECEAFLDQTSSSLYQRAENKKIATSALFRPYWTFANREECDMLIWVRKN